MIKLTQIKLLVLILATVITMLISLNTSAGSIRCGGTIIDDGDRRGITKQEIEKKCGQPYSQYGNGWIYSMPNGTVVRIRFKDNGEVSSITNEKI
ncbi:hypothetical protein [Kaarinaea lacus]